MERRKDRKKRWKGVRFIWVWGHGTFVKQRDTEVKVRKRGRGQCFDEDVNYYIWIVQIRIELVQFEDSEIGQAVIFLASDLMIEIVLQDTDITRIVTVDP
jgi:hypothetical protein